MINHWGVRSRVMLVAVLPMLVLAIVLTAFYTSTRLADLDEAHTARGQALARQLAAASEYAAFSGNRDALRQLAGALLAEGDIIGVRIVGRSGETLAHSGRIDESIPVPAVPTERFPRLVSRGTTLRIIEPILPASLDLDDAIASAATPETNGPAAEPPPVLGTVILDLSLERLDSKRTELWRAGTTSAVLVLIGSLILSSYMSRGVSGPIRDVARAVERIGHGNFSEQVQPVGGGSLRTLAEGVNRMAAQLASAHEEMTRQVADATSELRARKDEAERANLAKSRFLAAASHDLRQPMHALGLFVAELSQHAHAPAAKRLVEQIAASAEAMENLLDSLLDISKLDAGVLQPNVRAFALQPILERITAEQRRATAERGLTLKIRPTPHWIRSDPVLFERILGNLVSNAVRYTPRGRVLVACRLRGDSLRIEVRDNGIGIAPEAQEIIFQEFVQLNNPERSRDKGLGLGLAIVRRLTDLLGHRLTLRSSPGKGSVFAVEVPLAPAAEDAEAQEPGRRPGDLAGLQIALVDDDPLARAGMYSLLMSWGCEVVAASDAAGLLKALSLQLEPPRIVISDFRLHGPANGIEVIRTMRAHYGQKLPAVLISGDTGPDTLRLAQQDGVPLLHKPVRPARLRALLNRLPLED